MWNESLAARATQADLVVPEFELAFSWATQAGQGVREELVVGLDEEVDDEPGDGEDDSANHSQDDDQLVLYEMVIGWE